MTTTTTKEIARARRQLEAVARRDDTGEGFVTEVVELVRSNACIVRLTRRLASDFSGFAAALAEHDASRAA